MNKVEAIRDALIEAVLVGAAEVLAVKQAGDVGVRFKDAKELVTVADERSDAAILAVFRNKLTAIDPEISFQLEESGISGANANKRAGADPIDGTTHFASGGHWYAVQAHYVEDGVPLVGVIFQPEYYLPLEMTPRCRGRIAWAVKGSGAFVRNSELMFGSFVLAESRVLRKRPGPVTGALLSCVPVGTKMTDEERARAIRVCESGVASVSTGTGCAGGNVMLVIFGGQHVYANFGAGEDLDLIPPQVIAEEAGLTVWGVDRQSPRWHVRKQPFVIAPNEEIAGKFLDAAGFTAH